MSLVYIHISNEDKSLFFFFFDSRSKIFTFYTHTPCYLKVTKIFLPAESLSPSIYLFICNGMEKYCYLNQSHLHLFHILESGMIYNREKILCLESTIVPLPLTWVGEIRKKKKEKNLEFSKALQELRKGVAARPLHRWVTCAVAQGPEFKRAPFSV